MTAVAIFVKTPGYSPIKTRLAEGIGQALAESCHSRSAACVADVVQRSGLKGYWAVAESAAIDEPLWRQFENIDQLQGSLGERMRHVHSTLMNRHGSAILVGADLPQLSVDDLKNTADWIDSVQPRSVLGPAYDGGFWLFGANRAYPQSAWTSVNYSQSDTARRFVQALGPGKWKTLAKRRDIDQASDLSHVVDELMQLDHPTSLQRKIAAWLAELTL